MRNKQRGGNYSEGKSGSWLWCSPDGKYIIKTMTNGEAAVLNSIISDYFHVH